jgi:hypothetical protein
MSMLLWMTREVRLDVDGLETKADDLTVRSTCRRCGREMIARVYRQADYASLAALAAGAVANMGRRDAAAVLAHLQQCRGGG